MTSGSAKSPHSGLPDSRRLEPTELGPLSTPSTSTDAEDKKLKKRGLFGFGKKKLEDIAKKTQQPPPPRSNPEPRPAAPEAVDSQLFSTRRTASDRAASPTRSNSATRAISPSPPGGRAASTSPRLSSPGGSQIFERDVQESSASLATSPAIPSHIQTENFIPPVLDASSEAITDDHLTPDNVEIITHAAHQPAALAVAGSGSTLATASSSHPTSAAADLSPGSQGSHWVDELAAFTAQRVGTGAGLDSSSNYGSFDTTDVRRLSFISFADVVQGELQLQQASNRDSSHPTGLTSLSLVGLARSSSPIRSPVSSAGGGTSPPTSKSGSVKGLDAALTSSPSRKSVVSPTSTSFSNTTAAGLSRPIVAGEVAFETMSQALKRTASDLGR